MGVRMTHLTTCRSRFEANVLAARLGADGIVTEARSSLGPSYPFGKIDLYVEEGAFRVARQLLLPVDADAFRAVAGSVRSVGSTDGSATPPAPESGRLRPWYHHRWVRVAALGTLVAALFARVH